MYKLYQTLCSVLAAICVCLVVYIALHRTAPVLHDDTRIVTTTTTHRADGTTVTSTITRNESKTQVSNQSSPYKLTRYSILLMTNPLDLQNDVRVGVAGRIGDLPVFVTGEYGFKFRDVSVGLRYDW